MSNDAPPPSSRVRLAPDERREQILQAALEAFHTKGFGQTSVRDLAEATGMSIAGMYHYFNTKDDILFAIIESSVDRLLAAIQTARQSAESPEARIHAMLAAMVHAVAEDRASIRVLIDNADRLAPERQELIRAKRRESALNVRAELECIQAAGKLRELNLNVATFALNGMANWIYYWYHPEGEVDVETLVDQLAEMFFHGILKRE